MGTVKGKSGILNEKAGGLKMARNQDLYLHIRISEDLKRKTEQMAEQDGQKISDWIRDLIKKESWKRERPE